jgi:DNA-binding FadR family transcriptional regulator
MHIEKASQNKLLPLLLNPIHRLMTAVKSKILSDIDEANEAVIFWHTKIFEKIKNQDPGGAEKAMTMHLKITEKQIEQAIRASEVKIKKNSTAKRDKISK